MEHAAWVNIRNPVYSQWVGREELFERERSTDPDFARWDEGVRACAASAGTIEISTDYPAIMRKHPMLTDAPLRHRHRASFLESDRIKTLNLPERGVLPALGRAIECTMQTGKTTDVRRACADFLTAVSEFYEGPDCGIRVLSARPIRVRETWTTESVTTIPAHS